jgi:hypothetical protein
VVGIDRSENTVYEVISDGQVDVVLLEETLHEVAQLFVVEFAVLVFVELDEELLDFLVQSCGFGLKVFQLVDDGLELAFLEFSGVDHFYY